MSKPEGSRCTFQVSSFHPEPDTDAGRFLEGVVASHAGEQGWAAFPQSYEPATCVPPTLEPCAPPAAGESPSTELQERWEALLREAQQEAQRLKEEAYATGFAAGEQRGFEGGQQREALLHSLGQALRDMGGLRARIFEQSEHQLLELALAIARKVLHHEGSVNRGLILPLVRAGIKKATQRQELRIKVHPADMLFTVSCKAQLLGFLDGIETIIFEEDDAVPPGSCVVETAAEIVDLRWDEQLEEVASSLFRVYERGRREENG